MSLTWKKNKVLSIETREGLYVLAQMIDPPFVIFYDIFREKEYWQDVELNNLNVLFCNGVTRQFLKNSNISFPKIKPAEHHVPPGLWINSSHQTKKVIIWQGEPQEKEILLMGNGGSLIERDISVAGIREEQVLIPSISADQHDIIDKYELTNLRLFKELNERLYLCYYFKSNVDPLKDLIFNRPIAKEYKKYIQIISS